MPASQHTAPAAPRAAPDDMPRPLAGLPLVLLHEHLDGGLRPGTLLELCQARGITPPAPDEPSLRAWFAARAHAGSLEEYLRGFALTVSAMATPAALERVAFEAAEDALAEGAVLAEFRIAPLLFEPFGVDPDVAVEALVAGLRRSALPSGLIVCAMRHERPQEVLRAADLALRHQGRGVVAFDLAGAEKGFPASRHAAALRRVRDAGLGLTLHAGESDAGPRVLEAAALGATRIGHGVRLADAFTWPEADREALFDAVRAHGLHLELCPTSNVHTGAVPSFDAHPVLRLWRASISCSVHTDNRLISQIDHRGEMARVHTLLGATPGELADMAREAVRHAFLEAPARAAATAAIARWQAGAAGAA